MLSNRNIETLHVILVDQLSPELTALHDFTPSSSCVLMIEATEEFDYVAHHKQKIVLHLSAMRHFAVDLQRKGMLVDYVRLTDPDNSGNLAGEIIRAELRHQPKRIIVTEPGEWRLVNIFKKLRHEVSSTLEIRPDNRFFVSHQRFQSWTANRKQWRMEHFYREIRRENNILMDGNVPCGGKWNWDHDNRKSLPRHVQIPRRKAYEPDKITHEVIKLVSKLFSKNFGHLDKFAWPVTRVEALEALQNFVCFDLATFGTYQDAMKQGEPFLFHSILSPALNLGLLTPREVCFSAERAWKEGKVPLNAAEGFIRQVLGWREYVRGIYWALMPEYKDRNYFGANRPLPKFYWSGETKMNCMHHIVSDTKKFAYSHHIQRLMVTGNFALLAGIDTHEIERWYLTVYADAFEWVEMPNTLGMATYADGGCMASKPYAASGAYINKMSDFCRDCHYNVKAKTGAAACPFNYLYWGFLSKNQQLLEKNPRMFLPYRTISGWGPEQKQLYLDQTQDYLDSLY